MVEASPAISSTGASGAAAATRASASTIPGPGGPPKIQYSRTFGSWSRISPRSSAWSPSA